MIRPIPPALFALAAASFMLTTAVAADPLLYAPIANGRFEAAGYGWALGPGTTLGDADYSGDREAAFLGSTSEARIETTLPQAPVPPALRLTFKIERGSLLDASFRVTLIDARDAAGAVGVLAGGAPAVELSWNYESLSPDTYHVAAVDADATGIPGWDAMTPEERGAELENYVVYGFSVYAGTATHAFGTLFDDVQLVVDA